MKVDSTSIREIEYDDKNRYLDVVFWSGNKYRYFDVTQDIFEEFRGAESLGKYFNQTIKKNHGCQRLYDPEPSAF